MNERKKFEDGEGGRFSSSSFTSQGSDRGYCEALAEDRLCLVHQLTSEEKTEDILWDLFSDDQGEEVNIDCFQREIILSGLQEDDPRIRMTVTKLREYKKSHDSCWIPEDGFKLCVADDVLMLSKIFGGSFCIKDFSTFSARVRTIFESMKLVEGGSMPHENRLNPDHWGVAVCTVDGQRTSFGDSTVPFPGQSTTNPLMYALAATDLGAEVVHKYVGAEPSGRSFNEITLDSKKRPHNPMINAGAIITCSMLKRDMTIHDRMDDLINKCRALAGYIGHVGFNNQVYEDEREISYRNYALGYFMKEKHCFPPDTNLQDTLDIYFRSRAIEFTAESLSVVAAALANGGICPLTEELIIDPQVVRNTLSIMFSCGMYDYSGQFAFRVGVPAKSCISGAIMLVIPNVCGIVTFSPPLDDLGNSVKGVQFCRSLVDEFPFHNFDSNKTEYPQPDKVNVVELLFAASSGDISAFRRCSLQGIDLNIKDYDQRTALHIAACEGHFDLVKFLVERCKVDKTIKDRWGFTAEEEAAKFNHPHIADFLRNCRSVSSATPGGGGCDSASFSSIV